MGYPLQQPQRHELLLPQCLRRNFERHHRRLLFSEAAAQEANQPVRVVCLFREQFVLVVHPHGESHSPGKGLKHLLYTVVAAFLRHFEQLRPVVLRLEAALAQHRSRTR